MVKWRRSDSVESRNFRLFRHLLSRAPSPPRPRKSFRHKNQFVRQQTEEEKRARDEMNELWGKLSASFFFFLFFILLVCVSCVCSQLRTSSCFPSNELVFLCSHSLHWYRDHFQWDFFFLFEFPPAWSSSTLPESEERKEIENINRTLKRRTIDFSDANFHLLWLDFLTFLHFCFCSLSLFLFIFSVSFRKSMESGLEWEREKVIFCGHSMESFDFDFNSNTRKKDCLSSLCCWASS